MTKAELEKDRDEWKQQAESLQEELNSLNDAYTDLELQLVDTVNSVGDYYISDVDNFISRLKMEDLYTPELEAFMAYYMRYHNDFELG
jgi:hypothetical protein